MMPSEETKSKILIEQAKNDSSYVGLYKENNILVASFPVGFHLDQIGKQDINGDIFNDIRLLINILIASEQDGILSEDEMDGYYFPIYEYFYVIEYFIAHNFNFYKETETKYDVRDSGKVSWSKTIKRVQPSFIDRKIFYLDTVRRHNSPNENNLITLINKYCVYQSLSLFGNLYGGIDVEKPIENLDDEAKEYWVEFLRYKINQTNNDSSKTLFDSMISILNNENQRDENNNTFAFGTRKFDLVWQNIVDKVFGSELDSSQKKLFNPRAEWKLEGCDWQFANPLFPDTIYIDYSQKVIYIIDAKYYTYGIKIDSKDISNLPATSDINKQFSYTAHAKEVFGNQYTIDTSAFIIPWDKHNGKLDDNSLIYAGCARCDWYKNDGLKLYAILADTKDLIESYLGYSNIGKTDFVEIIKKSETII